MDHKVKENNNKKAMIDQYTSEYKREKKSKR